MESVARRIIAFLVELERMDRLRTGVKGTRCAAVDLWSAVIYEEDPDFPDGECLVAELPSGRRISVGTRKLLDSLILRHAQAEIARSDWTLSVKCEAVFDRFPERDKGPFTMMSRHRENAL